MSTAVAETMTIEEFLALPEDGVHRELIRGEVREMGMTVRNRFHCRAEGRIVQALNNWLDLQPEPRGEVLSGEAGFRLRGTPESLVGIDVAYVSAELVASTPPGQKIYNGPPILAVEVLSPSDKHEEIVEMIDLYLEAGVIVCEVDPGLRRVGVHRPGRELEMFTESRELTIEPELPGFRVAVAKLFG